MYLLFIFLLQTWAEAVRGDSGGGPGRGGTLRILSAYHREEMHRRSGTARSGHHRDLQALRRGHQEEHPQDGLRRQPRGRGSRLGECPGHQRHHRYVQRSNNDIIAASRNS